MSATDTNNQSNQLENKRTYSVPEIAAILQIGRSKAYDLCKENQFAVIRVGKSVRISKKSFDSWLDCGGI
jgi:excisionase family DNA binding protein